MRQSFDRVVRTRPPAKLNLFLELLGKRADGYHEIDTVMVPVDLHDELSIRRVTTPGVRLRAAWQPTEQSFAERLGVAEQPERREQLLHIPTDEGNLVVRALLRMQQSFQADAGFDVELLKRIPAGAGLGGASSDAAAALLCAAELLGLDADEPQLMNIAGEIGSDVPFFLGKCGPINAARARGRGERLESVQLADPLSVVIVYPDQSLSTAEVYANSRVPLQPLDATQMIAAMETGSSDEVAAALHNRLTEPAQKIAARIHEILGLLWQSGAKGCQLTGSGSACFAITESIEAAEAIAAQLRGALEPGAIIMTARTTEVPPSIEMEQ